jgi:DNA mismatch endonuclease (patch repair protein)
MDMFSIEKRSEVMSRIRGSGNRATELKLISIFRQFGITGWRRKSLLQGKPDFVFRAERLAIFVDGCFWHKCPTCFRRPSSNQLYWDAKLARNVKRDRRVTMELRRDGWSVVRLWQHELADEGGVATRVRRTLSRAKGKLNL